MPDPWRQIKFFKSNGKIHLNTNGHKSSGLFIQLGLHGLVLYRFHTVYAVAYEDKSCKHLATWPFNHVGYLLIDALPHRTPVNGGDICKEKKRKTL